MRHGVLSAKCLFPRRRGPIPHEPSGGCFCTPFFLSFASRVVRSAVFRLSIVSLVGDPKKIEEIISVESFCLCTFLKCLKKVAISVAFSVNDNIGLAAVHVGPILSQKRLPQGLFPPICTKHCAWKIRPQKDAKYPHFSCASSHQSALATGGEKGYC